MNSKQLQKSIFYENIKKLPTDQIIKNGNVNLDRQNEDLSHTKFEIIN